MTDEPLQATISLRGIIFDAKDTVLIVKRTSDGGWELPGGRLDKNEDCVAGLKRELREETGLNPVVEQPVHSVSWRNSNDNGRFAVYYRCYTEDRTTSLSAEHVDYEWLPKQVARERLSDPQQKGVRRASMQTSSSSSEPGRSLD